MQMRLFFILLLIMSCVYARSQEKEFIFKNYSMEEGLPSNEAYTVFCDSKNYIWMATDKGVVRFDGKKMEHFDLPDNVIFKIFEDTKHRIWFFSSSGQLAYYFEGKIYPYQYNDVLKKEVIDPVINSAYVDDEDNIYLNGNNRYNYIIYKKGIVQKKMYDSPVKDTIKFEINEYAKDKWTCSINRYNFYTKHALFLFKNKKPLLQKVSFDILGHYGLEKLNTENFIFFSGKYLFRINSNKIATFIKLDQRILCVNIQNENLFHIGLTNTGMVDYDSNLNVIGIYRTLNTNSVTGIAKDYEDGLWVSTLENGVYHLMNKNVFQLHYGEIYKQPVFRICENNNEELLFANTKGIYKCSDSNAEPISLLTLSDVYDFTKRNDTCFLSVGGSPNISKTYFQNMTFKDRHIELLNTRTKIIRLKNQNILESNGVFLSEVSLKNNHVLDYKTNAIKTSCLFEDNKKGIWLCTSNGLYQYDQSKSIPEKYPYNQSVFNVGVTYMNQFKNDIFAFGLRNKGLAIMKDTNLLGIITQKDGMASNSIKFILPIKNQLWLVSEKGVSSISFSSFSPLAYSIINIGPSEGLSNLVINQLVPYKGNILAATSNGIYVIENPNQFFDKPNSTIPFYITNVQSYKGDTANIQSISLPLSKNKLKIEFNGVSFQSAKDIVYQYRFRNADTVWNTTSNEELLLENLSPGEYALELRATIPNKNRFSEILSLHIIVEKPFWQNGWFLLLAAFILTGLIYLFYRNRVNAIRTKANVKIDLNKKMLDLEQVALHSQMNPHFIFNCLTSIQQLIVSGKTLDANEYLVKFARLMRKTLENAANSYISLESEKEFLEEYVNLEQLRIPGQFDFHIELPDSINPGSINIPNMIIQPLVENSIRHGIMGLENKKGKIEIQFKKQNEWIVCTITDNGVGYNPATISSSSFFTKHKSFGKEIVQKRLQLLHDGKEIENLFTINILKNEDGSNAGTNITILLPIQIK